MRHDAIIIGAGPSGSSAAIALAQQGRSVALVERSAFPRRKVCGEFLSAVNLQLLDRLGVGQSLRDLAGPEIERLALFAAGPGIEASMPAAAGNAFGRALGRDVLDGLLVSAAQAAGVTVLQPWRATAITRERGDSVVRIESKDEATTLVAPVIIAAHGSWEPGGLPSQLEKTNRADDIFGFKAYFKGGKLAADLMPLLAFPGGYGGMVWADQGRLSLSCCVRRDQLARIRQRFGGGAAGEAVFRHILECCPGVTAAVADAVLDGQWLAAGPIRPGIRSRYADDIFRIGNVAGESHPIIAEGISMALQSGWLLATALSRVAVWDEAGRAEAGRRYSVVWRQQFGLRVHTAAVLARLAVLPQTAWLMRAVVDAFPASLSLGARLSGKTALVPNL